MKFLAEDWLQSFAREILDAKYYDTDVTDVFNKLEHLSYIHASDL